MTYAMTYARASCKRIGRTKPICMKKCASRSAGSQGFASGSLEADAAAVRLFADAGLEMLLAQSYAKNMGVLSLPPLHASYPQILQYNVDVSVASVSLAD